MLTVKLKELEKKQRIIRECLPEVPERVVYSLPPIALQLRPILNSIFDWAIDYVQTILKELDKFVYPLTSFKY